jgi:hypothetical protein
MVKTKSRTYGSDDSGQDVPSLNLNIHVMHSFDPTSPTGLRSRVVQDPDGQIDEDGDRDEIQNVKKKASNSRQLSEDDQDEYGSDEDDGDEIVTRIQKIRRKENGADSIPRSKKNGVVDDDDDEESGDGSDESDSGYDAHPELDDTEDLPDDDDEEDGAILTCVQRSIMRRK